MPTPLLTMHKAHIQSANLPPLLLEAQRLANGVISGSHGRKRAGSGEAFWQYRPAHAADNPRMIDHRASAKGDQDFIREREWQIAQQVLIFCDQSAAMRYASKPDLPEKIARARLFVLAICLALNAAGERFGLFGSQTPVPPALGRAQILRMAQALLVDAPQDYSDFPPFPRAYHARALVISDFLGPFEAIEALLTHAANQGVRGVMLQILDPAEVTFPFEGRVILHSIQGTLQHETLKADALRDQFAARLKQRQNRLQQLCARVGWRYGLHQTDASAHSGMLWLHQALKSRGRR